MTAELVQVALGKTWGNRAMPLRARVGGAVRESQRIDRSAASSKRSTMSAHEAAHATIWHRAPMLNP
jgi:hypothetical protein